MDNVLQSLLSTINKEANNVVPPGQFSNWFNIATSFLISGLAKQYPKNQECIDILDPFIGTEMIPASEGFVQLPDDYRNLLGGPVVFANPKSDGQCVDIEPLTPENFATGVSKGGCNLNPVKIVDQTEFAYLTRSSYNMPTWRDPIAFFSGKKKLKICPFDVSKVGILYVKNEPTFLYSYEMNPDDTYFFKEEGSVESIWGSNAFSYLYKGVLSIYGAYASDPSIRDFSNVLNNSGIF